MNDSEVAVIGLGPAGVSAAIYLKRYGMNPVCFEKELVGGKVNKTQCIENYAGLLSIEGPKLAFNLETQLKSFLISPIYREVESLTRNADGTFRLVYGRNAEQDFRYVILANGLGERPFPIPGQEKFHSRGISRCAICDGPFYKGKDVAVVGGGDSAFEEAIYLATICHHVHLIARRKEFRAQEEVVSRFLKMDNVTLHVPCEVISADGEKSISSIQIHDKERNLDESLTIQGLFLYVGEVPCLDFIRIPNLCDERGYLITDSSLRTKVENLYATGDCRNTSLRQVATAVSDGAFAASNIHEDYLRKQHA
jgi:thioredoxin reductase (NADPH)